MRLYAGLREPAAIAYTQRQLLAEARCSPVQVLAEVRCSPVRLLAEVRCFLVQLRPDVQLLFNVPGSPRGLPENKVITRGIAAALRR